MARKYRCDLTAEELRAAVIYSRATGSFWDANSGREIGNNRSGMYAKIYVRGRSYLAHRLAWLYVHGEWPSKQIDHIDGNPRNNEINNLREVDDIENHQNTLCRGYRFDARYGTYRAQIKVRKQWTDLGSYRTAEEARAAYEAASIKYFGEFSGVHRGMKQ